jgi:UDP-N-acetylmuramyl pentapeptide phosphotransferase/UDP-N-acetylglucosamine-1-phosphate transferase
MTEPVKNTIDIAAGLNGLAAFLSYLPEVAAALTIIWYGGRIVGVCRRWLSER